MNSFAKQCFSKKMLGWRSHFVLFLWMLFIVAGVFWETIAGTINIWWDRSDTYVHGMFVIPAVCWMIYDQRRRLFTLSPNISLLGLILLAGVLLLWFIANLAEISVGKQLSFFMMIPILVLIAFGYRVTKQLSFPLAYLIFAVPVGEFLIPPLMDFTAWFAVTALDITGIPVYQDGLSFEIPTGSFNVIKACSGIRYLIASIALGCLYAYLTYRATWRRVLFIALSVFFPIIANGFRAYGIVMISYLSEGKLGSGVDHFIYGWVWFGIVMFLMFLIGTIWREKSKDNDNEIRLSTKNIAPCTLSKGVISIILLSLLVVFFATFSYSIKQSSSEKEYDVKINFSSPGWVETSEPNSGWNTSFNGKDYELKGSFTKDGAIINYSIPFYSSQYNRKELISVGNRPYDGEWKLTKSTKIIEQIGLEKHNINELKIKDVSAKGLVWRWYVVGGKVTTNSLEAKLLQLKTMVTIRDSSAYAVHLMIRSDMGNPEARAVLRDFAKNMRLNVIKKRKDY